MRLERNDYAAFGECGTRGLQRGFDLGRMMRVVVDKRDSGEFTEYLEATLDTRKRLEAGKHPLELGAKRNSRRNGRESVANVVHSRHAQGNGAELLVVIADRKCRPAISRFDIRSHQSGVR